MHDAYLSRTAGGSARDTTWEPPAARAAKDRAYDVRQGADPHGRLPGRRPAQRGRGGRRGGRQPHAGARGLPAAGGRGPHAPLPQARRPGRAGVAGRDRGRHGHPPAGGAPRRRARGPAPAGAASPRAWTRSSPPSARPSTPATRPRFVEADRDFHRTIVEAAGNAILARLYDQLRDRLRRMSATAIARDPAVAERFLDRAPRHRRRPRGGRRRRRRRATRPPPRGRARRPPGGSAARLTGRPRAPA